MGHSLTLFFMDRGSFVRYVMIDCFPPYFRINGYGQE